MNIFYDHKSCHKLYLFKLFPGNQVYKNFSELRVNGRIGFEESVKTPLTSMSQGRCGLALEEMAVPPERVELPPGNFLRDVQKNKKFPMTVPGVSEMVYEDPKAAS